MTISTYTELQTAVTNWLGRTDLADRIPEFIMLAEAKFNRKLAVRQMEKRATTVLDTSSSSPEFISLPTDFRSMRWVRLVSVTGRPHLEYKSPVALDEIRTSVANSVSRPRWFTMLASDIEICPSPDSNYTLEMVYRQYLPALSAANPTNWLLSFAPDAYLYGALLEAQGMTANDERIPVWMTAYKEVIADLNALTNISSYGAAPVSITPASPTP